MPLLWGDSRSCYTSPPLLQQQMAPVAATTLCAGQLRQMRWTCTLQKAPPQDIPPQQLLLVGGGFLASHPHPGHESGQG